MTLKDHLNQFYFQNNIPEDGGLNHKTFVVPLPFAKITLPNFNWRKRMLHIHDLEHILNNQNTSWEGEIFIASWEISTGFFKNFPIILFPLWAMGWGLWEHPLSVWNGFKRGQFDFGIANLDVSKDILLEYTIEELRAMTIDRRKPGNKLFLHAKFIFWVAVSQFVFLFPFLLLVFLIL